MKTAGVSDYTNQTPHKHFEWIKYPCPTAVINKTIAHLQCMNNHYAKFKYYGIKIVGGTDYTNQTPSKHLTEKKI